MGRGHSGRRRLGTALGVAFVAWLVVGQAISVRDAVGAWWGALIPILAIVGVLGFYWLVDHVGPF
jgi:hypothetical protein